MSHKAVVAGCVSHFALPPAVQPDSLMGSVHTGVLVIDIIMITNGSKSMTKQTQNG